MRRARVAVGTALFTALVVLSCHRIVGARDVPPQMFVGVTKDGGLVGIVTTDSIGACTRGEGEARFLPLAGNEKMAETPFLTLSCARLFPPTAQELSQLLDGEGGSRGEAEIPENEAPLELRSHGFLRIPGEWLTEYYLRYNRAYIRLVRWSFGNHWGSEVDHTYRIDLVDDQRWIRTVRSRDRSVEMD